MNINLKKISFNLNPLISNNEFNNITELYRICNKLFFKHYDYFSRFDAENLIKIVLYIYSLKKTNNFQLAEQMISNLFLVNLISTDGDFADLTCENCYGEGEFACGNCSGEGIIQCEECDGVGESVCTNCDGEGEIDDDTCTECNGSGEIKCENCDGSGEITCEDCYGSGTEMCDICDGDGRITSDDIMIYEKINLISWDSDLKNKCEQYENTETPVLEHYEFINKRNDSKFIILNTYIVEAEPVTPIENTKNYCYHIEYDITDIHKNISYLKKSVIMSSEGDDEYYVYEQ